MQLFHHYASELSEICSQVKPFPVTRARVAMRNETLAKDLGIDLAELETPALLSALFSNDGELQKNSIAQKYGGHQFGQWNPHLGDGRGLLLGEIKSPAGQFWDLHLKGAGPTPYSRFADGRAVLRSTIREYLASEALHFLGIPTSRALCLIDSDEPVYREKQERAAQLIRVCKSHIRFGHFEYFYHSKQPQKLQQLFDYCFKYHFTECLESASPYQAMLARITRDSAKLIAKWQAFGFNHGVMNTDNMSIHGITFDYGPYAFLDDFDPQFVSNHSDSQGRYSFDSQPGIGLWNLNALAQAFTPHLDVEQIQLALSQYEPCLLKEYSTLMQHKLGLMVNSSTSAFHSELINSLLDMLSAENKDYSIIFRQLCEFDVDTDNTNLRDQFVNRERFEHWAKQYKLALSNQSLEQKQRQMAMRQRNPQVILRNYLAQQVIDRAEEGDFTMLNEFIRALKTPFESTQTSQKFSQPPPAWGKQLEISCSS